MPGTERERELKSIPSSPWEGLSQPDWRSLSSTDRAEILGRHLDQTQGLKLLAGSSEFFAALEQPGSKSFALRSLPEPDEGWKLPEHIERINFTRESVRLGRVTETFWKAAVISSDVNPTAPASVQLAALLEAPDGGSQIQAEAGQPTFFQRQSALIDLILKPAGLKWELEDDVFSEALADADLTGKLQDNGIGRYEFWGEVGTHHDWRFEADGPGEFGHEFAVLDYPLLSETASGSRSFFHVTSAKYSERCDEFFEDGYDVDVDVAGQLERVEISPQTILHDGQRYAFLKVQAVWSWEQR